MSGSSSQPSVAETVNRYGTRHSISVQPAGQKISGAVVSTTVIVWTQEAVLPQSSVAVQVRVMVSVRPQPGTEESEWLTDALPQESVAVAEPVADTSVESPHSTVASGGQVMTGGVVSTTVIVWTQEAVLPQSSVAVQVREMVSVLPQPGAEESEKLTVASPHVSVAVAEPVAEGPVGSPHSTVASGGQVMTGGVVSTTVIVWTQEAVLPQSSVAVQVREMVSVLPQPGAEESEKLTVASPHVSVAVAEPVAEGPVGSPHSTVASAGQVMTGGVVSTTVIVWTQEAVLPQSSVAVQVREMVSVLPQPGAEESEKLTEASPQESLAVAEPVAEGPVGSPHSTVASAGQVMSGGVVSTTEIVWTQEAVLPQSSVAVQVREMVSVLPQPGAEESEKLTVASPHESLAVAEPVAEGPVGSPHSTVASAGQLMTGGVVSTTKIVWTQEAVLPQSSVAVQVREMVSVLPQPGAEESAKLTEALPHESLAVAEPVAEGPVGSPHSTVASGGHEMTGGVVSTTVIVWTQEAVLPQSSVAVQVREMVSVLPQPGAEESEKVTAASPHESLAVAEPVAEGPVGSPHSTVASAGQVMTGGVVSTTVIVWTQEAVLPQSSVRSRCG